MLTIETIDVIFVIKMNSELDRIKSSITISLGVKNRLRELKGSLSYEDFIAKLIRTRNEIAHKGSYVEIQKFERKQLVYSFQDFKFLFEFNKYNNSPNFIFDIIIKRILRKGKEISIDDFFNPENKYNSAIFEGQKISFGYWLYFELLTSAIKSQIEPMFKHKGRFEDYYLWKEEFNKLGLSKKAYENDVTDKLTDYTSGVLYR
jgi:hypothetical protein